MNPCERDNTFIFAHSAHSILDPRLVRQLAARGYDAETQLAFIQEAICFFMYHTNRTQFTCREWPNVRAFIEDALEFALKYEDQQIAITNADILFRVDARPAQVTADIMGSSEWTGEIRFSIHPGRLRRLQPFPPTESQDSSAQPDTDDFDSEDDVSQVDIYGFKENGAFKKDTI